MINKYHMFVSMWIDEIFSRKRQFLQFLLVTTVFATVITCGAYLSSNGDSIFQPLWTQGKLLHEDDFQYMFYGVVYKNSVSDFPDYTKESINNIAVSVFSNETYDIIHNFELILSNFEFDCSIPRTMLVGLSDRLMNEIMIIQDLNPSDDEITNFFITENQTLINTSSISMVNGEINISIAIDASFNSSRIAVVESNQLLYSILSSYDNAIITSYQTFNGIINSLNIDRNDFRGCFTLNINSINEYVYQFEYRNYFSEFVEEINNNNLGEFALIYIDSVPYYVQKTTSFFQMVGALQFIYEAIFIFLAIIFSIIYMGMHQYLTKQDNALIKRILLFRGDSIILRYNYRRIIEKLTLAELSLVGGIIIGHIITPMIINLSIGNNENLFSGEIKFHSLSFESTFNLFILFGLFVLLLELYISRKSKKNVSSDFSSWYEFQIPPPQKSSKVRIHEVILSFISLLVVLVVTGFILFDLLTEITNYFLLILLAIFILSFEIPRLFGMFLKKILLWMEKNRTRLSIHPSNLIIWKINLDSLVKKLFMLFIILTLFISLTTAISSIREGEKINIIFNEGSDFRIDSSEPVSNELLSNLNNYSQVEGYSSTIKLKTALNSKGTPLSYDFKFLCVDPSTYFDVVKIDESFTSVKTIDNNLRNSIKSNLSVLIHKNYYIQKNLHLQESLPVTYFTENGSLSTLNLKIAGYFNLWPNFVTYMSSSEEGGIPIISSLNTCSLLPLNSSSDSVDYTCYIDLNSNNIEDTKEIIAFCEANSLFYTSSINLQSISYFDVLINIPFTFVIIFIFIYLFLKVIGDSETFFTYYRSAYGILLGLGVSMKTIKQQSFHQSLLTTVIVLISLFWSLLVVTILFALINTFAIFPVVVYVRIEILTGILLLGTGTVVFNHLWNYRLVKKIDITEILNYED